MEAVIATGGKQYRVTPGRVISVEKLPAGAGGTVEFTPVLMVQEGGAVTSAPADLQSAKVVGEVIAHTRAPKVAVVKFKRRKNYRRTRGHRQPATTVRITRIEV